MSGRAGGESGHATVEWVGLVLAVSLFLGGLLAAPLPMDGRSLAGFLAYRITCAASGGCEEVDRALERAYGERDAALVRRHAPNLVYEPGERQLPVDWRRCRTPRCASAPDDRSLDAHHTGAGRATVFTRVIRRGGRIYVQYWLYYPDSNTTWAGADRIWERSWLLPRLRELVFGNPDWPGFHRDDWESVHVRLDRDGTTWVRASSHGGYASCETHECRAGWRPSTGWVRVSRGSHAGQVRPVPPIPGRNPRERATTGEGLRLVPLETHDTRPYRSLDQGVKPPWRKEVYADPESEES